MYNTAKIPEVANTLSPFERDCCITVALKIVDGTCKMDGYEKSIFMLLYESLQIKQSEFFEESVFDLIDEAKEYSSSKLLSRIKEHREAAMEYITRPRMKSFKANVRERISEHS